MIQEGLVNLLANDAGTVALLGTPAARALLDPEGRANSGIFPVEMPEGTPLPAIVYSDIHHEGLMTMDGPDVFTIGRMQFSCRGVKYADAKHVARAIRQAFEAFQGTLSDTTEVDNIHRISEVDTFEDAPFGYVTHVDFEIEYRDQAGNISNYQPANLPQFLFADGEIPAGALNGTNKNFTLANTPNPAASLILSINGEVGTPGEDFTLVGNAITTTVAPEDLIAWYRY